MTTGVRAERRTQNTARIIDAAIKQLSIKGYAATTVQSIAEAAKVSRGQVQNIFGFRRADLLNRIAQEIFVRYVEDYLTSTAAAQTPQELSEQMWDAIDQLYGRPETLALLEIWLSTRTDKVLNRSLRAGLLEVDVELGARWEAVFSSSGLGPNAVEEVRCFQRAMMRGLALEKLLGGPEAMFRDLLVEAREATRSIIRRHEDASKQG